MNKRIFWDCYQKVLEHGTDEQLRMLRCSIANELERRLSDQEAKYFKSKPIGNYKSIRS